MTSQFEQEPQSYKQRWYEERNNTSQPRQDTQSRSRLAPFQGHTPYALKWFYNLPLGRKQLIALIVAEFVSIAGLSVGARWIITTGLQTQLLNQAKSEVSVTDSYINLKVEQTGLGFRGLADNPTIIETAAVYANNKALPAPSQEQIKQILQNEIKARNIEYATLIGRDFRIIINANANRSGETFNPNNLVRQVFNKSKQIQANAIVRWAELAKESPPLAPSEAEQDALVRYTLTPVRAPGKSKVLAVLVSGDIVNGKLPVMAGILKDFKGGYSAIYSRKPTGEFALATSLDQGEANMLEQAKPNVALNDTSLLAAAASAPEGQIVSGRMVVGTQTYTMTALAIPNLMIQAGSGAQPVFSGQPVTILVRGTPETTLNNLLRQSLWQEGVVLLLALFVTGVLTLILRRTITEPIEQLGRTTQQFAEGIRQARATVFSLDEVGQLAVTFNKMADRIVTSEATLSEQARRQKSETERTQQFTNITLGIRQSLNLEDIFNTAVKEVRKVLKTNRVVIYVFDANWQGTVAAESITPGWTQLDSEIDDPSFRERYVKQYKYDGVRAIDNIYQAGLTDSQIRNLERFEVKASLVGPILKDNQLVGLLIAHQCDSPRAWQQSEIDLFSQLATQIGIALEQANLLLQIKIVSQEQRKQKEALQLFTNIALRIRQSLNLEDIFKATVEELRQGLKAERIVICRFKSNWDTAVIAESVAPGWTQALGIEIEDTCWKDRGGRYKTVRTHAIENIYQAGLPDCYIKQVLERFEVKASLVVPILTNNQIFGLLIAHQCSETRAWQQSEIDLFTQVANQVGIAVNQANLLEQVEKARSVAEVVSLEQLQQKEAIQHQLVKLLSDIEGASSGDLTVRAEVTPGEIGTVADFFNSIVESLRQIVTSVKKAATQVNVSVGENSGAIHQLADAAFKQAEDITHTLDSVEQMTLSIQAVADNARLAAVVARTASTTAEAGGAAMDCTVQSILNLRETVAETANKVKRLGESSQQISKIVFLIHQIALQTNLLAINASIEAARAGEEGRGFAVVAEEVGKLAAQSAAATKEIEQIVENIQQETSVVVQAMELGNSQVIEGAHLVEDTKKSLGKILDVSHLIDQLVQSISTATVSQAQTSEAVTQLMKEIAQVSEHTCDSSRQVSGSLQQTVEVAQQLQASVGKFKVGGET